MHMSKEHIKEHMHVAFAEPLVEGRRMVWLSPSPRICKAQKPQILAIPCVHSPYFQ